MPTQVSVRSQSSLSRWWRTLRVGYWLGWQIESNWTDPLLFFIYSIARPLGGVLILVFMYHVVARAGGAAMLGFFVVGTACWPFVVRGMMGTAYSLISDREHWRTLRYVYISPIPLRAYLVGPAVVRSLPQLPDPTVLGFLTMLTALWVAAALVAFTFAERRARQLGILDRETMY